MIQAAPSSAWTLLMILDYTGSPKAYVWGYKMEMDEISTCCSGGGDPQRVRGGTGYRGHYC